MGEGTLVAIPLGRPPRTELLRPPHYWSGAVHCPLIAVASILCHPLFCQRNPGRRLHGLAQQPPAPDNYHLYLYPILSISLLPSQTSRDEEKGEELSYQKGEELSYQRREG